MCDRMLEKAQPLSIERSFEAEPRVVESYAEYNLAMSMPVFSFGTKRSAVSLHRI